MKLNKKSLELRKLDPILEQIIKKNLKPFRDRGTVYESLLRSIISQQISVAAANSIRGKFLNLFSQNNH